MTPCPTCKGGYWVCENDGKPWPSECECGAGAPCPNCNGGNSAETEFTSVDKGTVKP